MRWYKISHVVKDWHSIWIEYQSFIIMQNLGPLHELPFNICILFFTICYILCLLIPCTHWVISSMVLEAGVGADNQNWALTSTLIYYRFKTSHRVKVRAYIWLFIPSPASNTILEITHCSNDPMTRKLSSVDVESFTVSYSWCTVQTHFINIQCIPEKRKPINQAFFFFFFFLLKTNDLSEKAYIVTKFSLSSFFWHQLQDVLAMHGQARTIWNGDVKIDLRRLRI